MTAIKTWRIEQMSTYPTHEGQADVVFQVHWRCNAVDGEHTATGYGAAVVSFNEDKDYTPYAELAQAQVLEWVWASGVDKDAVETALDQQIEDQISPPIVVQPLPWAA